jgi:phosphoglycerol transferase MdoB-like AlkP superfamily enzyme
MNFYKFKKNILIKRKRSVIVTITTTLLSIFSGFFLEYHQRSRDLTKTTEWVTHNPKNFFLGCLLILCIYLLFFAVIGNLFYSCIFFFILIGLLSFSNIQKLSKLGEPLYPVDFYHIRYIRSLLYVLIGTIPKFIIIVIVILTASMIYLEKKLPKCTLTFKSRILMFAMTSFFIYSYINYNHTFMKRIIKRAGITVVLWNQPHNYAHNGFVFGLLSNLQSTVMETPENYSSENIIEIANKYKEKADIINSNRQFNHRKPNIIFFLDETFWDPTLLSFLKFSADPMKNIRNTMECYPSGLLLSPTFGGETANVEFEVLTGLSMYNIIPGSIPYQQVLEKKYFIPSIVEILNRKDYDAMAIHPFNRVFYKRDRVYRNMGFKTFISEVEMRFNDKLGPYISDQSVVNEVIKLLEENENPLFIHAVTMQNHFPVYEGKFGKNTISVSGIDDIYKVEIETFIEGIKLTDIAIKDLIQKIHIIDEPTILVFYGDHLPVLNNYIYENYGFLPAEEHQKDRVYSETPLFIYSNFELEKRNIGTLSPAFLGVQLFNLLNEPINPYYALLESIRSKLPGLKNTVCVDASGNIIHSFDDELKSLLDDYKLIQYDLLIGNQYSRSILFQD